MDKNYRIVAEAVAINEQLEGYQSNDVFMAVKFRAMSTKENLNGDIIERSFMDSILASPALYIGTPIKVDIASLLRNKKLGHRFNRNTGEWETDQIGSIQSFEIEEGEDEDILYCTARIEKGKSEVCNAVSALYEDGALAFSFEIIAGDLRVENGVTYIGASENNYLTAMCVVTKPAYQDGYAVALAAEVEETDMEENKNLAVEAEVTETVEQVEAETEQVEAAANEVAEEPQHVEATENVEAAVVVHECHEEYDSVNAYDTDTGVEVRESVEHRVCVTHVEEDAQIVDTPVEAEAEETAVEAEAHENNNEMAALQAELEELRAFKANIEAEARERENVAKREKLKKFAECAGVDVDALAQEIHDLNYEAVCMAEIVEKHVEEQPAQKIEAEVEENNAFTLIDDMKLSGSKWAGYISDASGMNE